MLAKKDLTILKNKLPKGAYQLIAEEANCSKETVRQCLNQPKRYNEKIINAAIALVEREKKVIEDFKSKIQNL
jgi:hypothetical protein